MPITEVRIREISDMNEWGFARALVTLQLTPSVLNASTKISIDVPLQYTGEISVTELRAKVMAQVIASLRDAAAMIPQTPVPLLGIQPSDQPGTPTP